MNPADFKHLQDAVSIQGELLGRHDSQMSAILQTVQDLRVNFDSMAVSIDEQLKRLTVQAAAPEPPVAPSPPSASVPFTPAPTEPRLSPPERYAGEPGRCKSFLIQCSLIFELQPSSFPTPRSQVAYAITLLSGKPREWATREWASGAPCCFAFNLFSQELLKIFDYELSGREVAKDLLGLRQEGRCVADYAVDFRTLAAESKWNSFSLIDAFYHGLSDSIKDELATCEPVNDLESLISLSTRIDNRLRARQRERGTTRSTGRVLDRRSTSVGTHLSAPTSSSSSTLSSTPPASLSSHPPEPMQIGRTRLTPEERLRRMQDRCCLYCGQAGHFIAACPLKDRASR